MTFAKTDHASLGQKVALRRRVLAEAGIKLARVLDLYAGEGRIWAEMAKHVTVQSYVPCDREPRQRGTLKIDDSARLAEAFDFSRFNVVDIDPYGEPWRAWAGVREKLTKGTVVFLTHGRMMRGPLSIFSRRAMGIPDSWEIPKKLALRECQWKFFLGKESGISRLWKIERRRVTYWGLLIGGGNG